MEEKFSISFYEMSNTKNYGHCKPKKERYDLLNLVVIRLGDSVYNGVMEDEGYDVIRFLHTIMYPHKEDFLNTVKDYIDFSQNEVLWKEIDKMSGLGMSILEEGIEKGRKEDVIRMLKNNKSPEQIAEFCGYDLEYVKEIQKEIIQSE